MSGFCEGIRPMAENEASDTLSSKESQRSIRPDWLLCLTSDWAKTGLCMPVTLNVKGVIVTGNVITFEQYLEGVVNQLDEPGNGLANVISGALGDLRGQMFPECSEVADEFSNLNKPYEYIHLRDARMISGNIFIPTQPGFYWRGRLDQVDAFSFGSLSPT